MSHIPDVANEQFDPSENQATVLGVFEDVYQTSPGQIRERTGIKKQRINDILNDLANAGWVTKVSHGLYRLEYNGDCYVTNEVVCRDE